MDWLVELSRLSAGAAIGMALFVGGMRVYVRLLVAEMRLLRRQMTRVLRRLERHDVRIKVLEGGPDYGRPIDGFAEGPAGPDS